MHTPSEINRIIEQLSGISGSDRSSSRRSFLKLCGATVAWIASWQLLYPDSAMSAPLIITEQAQGLVIADPTKCVACRRCELACTDFNDGKSSPAMSRIKVRRNINFGPTGLYTGHLSHGDWGTGLIIQDYCKQCPHPVPCANACPSGAIVVRPPTNARVVEQDKCTGCGICRKACPWEMISFDPDTQKATKCFLCDGKPKCVEACPAEALVYAPWVDLTGKVPPRISTAVANGSQACVDCHQ
ncbi:MAG: 4Fe-4S dicluster domain-containing protein [Syntrophobacteraceae bacterium]|jgi:Fe-S-cluster-containing dehydrogenase component